MKFYKKICGLLFAVSFLWGNEAMNYENFLFNGRWEFKKECARTSAPAAMVTFKASAKVLEFEIEGDAQFRLDEDKKQVAVFKTKERKIYKVNSDNKPHEFRLIKISESNPGGIYLYNIKGDNSLKFFEAPKKSNRRVEFIGDSFTVGFGVEGKNGEPNEEAHVFEKTNASKSYAFLLADYFNADFEVNAFSGRGLVRNYDNIVPDWNVARLYKYTVPGFAPEDLTKGLKEENLFYDFKFHPQVIVVFLGINDFQGNGPYANENEFKMAYSNLLKELRQKHPGVKFLLVSTKIWPNDNMTKIVGNIYESEIQKGHSDLKFVNVITENTAIFGHPSVKSQQKMFEIFMPIIKQMANW